MNEDAKLAYSKDSGLISALLERVSDGIVAFDSQMNYTYVNARGGELLGRAPGDLIGKNYWAEYPEAKGTPIANAYLAALERQKAIQFEEYYASSDRWFENRIYPSPDGLSIFFADITEHKKAELALQESERRFREMLENIHLIAVLLDSEGRVTFCNEFLLQTTGYTRDEVIGCDWFTQFVPDTHTEVKETFLQGLERGEIAAQYENPIRTKSGTERIIRFSNTLLQDGQGKAIGTTSIGEDITERKEVEAALVESETRLRTIVQSEPECIKLLDADGILLDMNPAGLALVEADSLDEVAGEPIDGVLLPEYRDAFKALNAQVFRGESGNLEFEIVGLKGTRRWLETHAVPMRNAEGAIVSLLGLTRDITERRRAEDALRASETRYRSLFNSGPDGVFITDAEGNYLDVNPSGERLFGYTHEELLTMRIADLVAAEETPRVHPEVEEVKAGMNQYREWQFRRKDGSFFAGEVVAVPMPDGNLLGIVRDITERKRAEAEIHYQANLLGSMSDAIISTNLDFVIRSWNSAAEVIYGWRAEDAIAQLVGALIPTEHPNNDGTEILQHLRTGGFWKGEVIQKRKDGTSLYIFSSVSLTRDNDGNPIGYVAVNRDITAHKQAEIEKARFLNVLEASLNEIYMFDANTLHFQYVNDGARRNLGYSAEKLRTMTPIDIKSEFSEATFQKLLEPLRRHQKNKLVFQTFYRRADETRYPVEVQLQLVDQEGSALFLAIVNDITARKELEAAHQASESQYRLLFENMGEGFSLQEIITDEKGRAVDFRILSANQAYERHTGINPQLVIGKTAGELQPGKDIGHIEEYARVVSNGEPFECETFSPLLDRHFRVRAYRFQPGHFATIFEDISERKQAENALRESEEKLSNLIDASMQGVALIQEGKITYVNAANCAITGYSPEESLTLSSMQQLAAVHPDDRGGVIERQARAERGEPIAEWNELRIIRKDGDVRWVLTSTKKLTLQGKPARLGMMIDITERKKAEQETRLYLDKLTALNKAALQLQRLQSPQMLANEIIISLESILNYTYSALLLIDESSGRLIPFALSAQGQSDAFVEEDKKFVESWDIRVGKGITGWVAQTGEKVRSGNVQLDPRYMGLRDGIHSELCVPLKANERIIGVINIESTQADAYSEADEYVLETVAAQVSIAIQNTRLYRQVQKQSAELEQRVQERTAQLQLANNALESFSYSVSHDLRAPLRAIGGFAEIIARRHRSDLNAQGQHYFDNIVRASERMDHLIDDLLTYARLGRSVTSNRPVSLADLLQEIGKTLHPYGDEIHGILKIDESLPTIPGDPTLLGQIFTNLVENALKYHQPDLPPRVSVDWYAEDAYVIVCVRDNGIGIPPEQNKKIFDIFQRLHPEDEYAGTGIGLATVKKAVDLLGGEIWVESQVGKGATFFVKLPKDREADFDDLN